MSCCHTGCLLLGLAWQACGRKACLQSTDPMFVFESYYYKFLVKRPRQSFDRSFLPTRQTVLELYRSIFRQAQSST